jgi:hypothetical protein
MNFLPDLPRPITYIYFVDLAVLVFFEICIALALLFVESKALDNRNFSHRKRIYVLLFIVDFVLVYAFLNLFNLTTYLP